MANSKIFSLLFRCFLASCLTTLSFAQGLTCQTAELTPGTALDGALDANDCALRDAISSGTSTAYAKRFTFSLAEAAVVTLSAESSEFDTFLVLYATDPTRLAGSNDNAPDHPTNSKLVANLPAGSYVAIVSSPRPGLTGRFKINAAPEKPRECPLLTLAATGATEGSFTSSTCRFLDQNPFSTNDAFVTFYSLTIPRNGVLSIKADTGIANFSMVATISTTIGFRGNSELLASVPAGEALFSVSGRGQGTYSLNVSIEDQRPCALEPVEPGAEVNAALDAQGCRVLDFLLPSGDPTPVKLYRFTVDKAKILTIDQTSPIIDTYLILLNQQSRVLGVNDDRDRTTTDSRIVIHLPAGTYIAGASAFDATDIGPYTLKLAAADPHPCPAPDLVSGQAQEGTLSTEGCRFLDLVPLSTNVTLVTPFRVTTSGRKGLNLNLRSNVAGQTLSLLTPQFQEVVRNSVNPADRTLVLDSTVLAGPHTVLLYSAAQAAPTYNLTATVTDARDCPVADLGLNDAQDGTLSTADCRASEALVYTTLGSPARTYKMTLPARGRVTVTLDPAGFVPALFVTQGSDTPLTIATAQAPQRIGIQGIFPAGEYRFYPTTLDRPGSFTIRSTFQADGTVSAQKQAETEPVAEPLGSGSLDELRGAALSSHELPGAKRVK